MEVDPRGRQGHLRGRRFGDTEAQKATALPKEDAAGWAHTPGLPGCSGSRVPAGGPGVHCPWEPPVQAEAALSAVAGRGRWRSAFVPPGQTCLALGPACTWCPEPPRPMSPLSPPVAPTLRTLALHQAPSWSWPELPGTQGASCTAHVSPGLSHCAQASV